MTQPLTTLTEVQFRSLLGREICALIAGRTTYERVLYRLGKIRIGLSPLPQDRVSEIAGGIKLLLFSLRAEQGRLPPCEAKPANRPSSDYCPRPKGGLRA